MATSLTPSPCVVAWCTADAVAYVVATCGRSPRIIIIGGDRGAQLADHPSGQALCADHVLDTVEEALRRIVPGMVARV